MRKKFAIERKLRESRLKLDSLSDKSHNIKDHDEKKMLEGSIVALAWVLEKV